MIALRIVIACSAFIMVVGVGWAMSSHTLLTPQQRDDVAKIAAKERVGRIVFELADGKNCRYVRFDNATGAMADVAIGQCEDVDRQRSSQPNTGFNWGRQ